METRSINIERYLVIYREHVIVDQLMAQFDPHTTSASCPCHADSEPTRLPTFTTAVLPQRLAPGDPSPSEVLSHRDPTHR